MRTGAAAAAAQFEMNADAAGRRSKCRQATPPRSHTARATFVAVFLTALIASRAPSTASCCNGPNRSWPSRMQRRPHMHAQNARPLWPLLRHLLRAQRHLPLWRLLQLQRRQVRRGGHRRVLPLLRRYDPPALRCARHLQPQLAQCDPQLPLPLLQLNRLYQLQRQRHGLPSLWLALPPLRWQPPAAVCQCAQAAVSTPNTPLAPRCSLTRTYKRVDLLPLRENSLARLHPLPLLRLLRRTTTQLIGADLSPRPVAAATSVATEATWSTTSRRASLAPHPATTKPSCSRPT